jgi:N-methylhydantoinase A
VDRKYKLGIDVGGTFTDGVLLDTETGAVVNIKVPSTPKDPSIGFLNNLDGIFKDSRIDPSNIWFLVHGTTVATNAIIEGKTSKTALITTKGFRDILEIAFQIRPKLYDLFVEKPTPLVPRDLCFEVSERISYTGEVLEAIDPASVETAIDRLQEENIESVAVCLLHSYVNNVHEKEVKKHIQKRCPGVFITLSSEICPEFREYTRASTTVINSCIIPLVSIYVEKIEDGLKAKGLTCGCHLMQSGGGVVSSQVAKLEPCRIIESGPAAGVIAAAYIAERIGRKDTLCIDIGGTTAKIGLILGGQPRISPELEVGAAAFARSTATRASGYPLPGLLPKRRRSSNLDGCEPDPWSPES